MKVGGVVIVVVRPLGISSVNDSLILASKEWRILLSFILSFEHKTSINSPDHERVLFINTDSHAIGELQKQRK